MPEMNRGVHRETLAPGWHTALLVFVIVSVAVVGTLSVHFGTQRAPVTGQGRIVRYYLPMIAVQWLMIAYVTRVGKPRRSLRGLIGRRWNDPARAVIDLASAFVLAAAIIAAEFSFDLLCSPGRSVSLEAFLPSGPTETIVWGFVAVSAGFCEEVVYRGYLQTQLTAFAGYRTVGAFAQAVLFGIAHGEQGALVASRFAFYGLILGALCRSRQSLVPAILCHVSLDLLGGIPVN
jgi:uncharacterized protein